MAKQAGRDVVPGTIGSRPTELADRDSVNALLERMEAGDKAATTKFVDYLRGDRVLAAAVLERASTAMTHWLDYGTSEPLSRFVMEERAKQLRHSLLGESPTPLERLLVERIVICSVQLQIAEGQYVRVIKGGTTFEKAKFYEDLQDRAQRRYLAAIKALAQIRRLQLPAVAQLNVATQ